MDRGTVEFLKGLQETLNTQEIDGQASPRYWVIYDYQKIPTLVDFSDEFLYYIPDHEQEVYVEELYSFVDEVNDENDNTISEEDMGKLEELIKESEYVEVEEWLQEHIDDGSVIMDMKIEGYVVPNTMFITKEDAVEHLERNKHRYTSKAHTYAMTAFRSPMVSKLWKILEQTDWEKELQ